ncbi:MAG: BatD family protein [Saprospiraceae bacterium]
MMKFLLSFIFLLCTLAAYTQPIIKVEVSADTVTIGEFVEITYTIENGEGKFEAPDFTGLPVVSGPNTSSSYMIANGKKSSNQSYSYILRPMEEAILEIPAGLYVENEIKQPVNGLTIVVLPKDQMQSVPPGMQGKVSSKVNREKRKF